MRVFVGVLFGLAMNQAEASSFQIFGGDTAATPSIIHLGKDESATALRREARSVVAVNDAAETATAETLSHIRSVSASVIAMGKPAPVSQEQVAAIGADDSGKRRSDVVPVVMRGGIFGGAAPEPVALASPEEAKPKLSRPQQRKMARDIRRAVREGRMPAPGTAEAAPAAATPPNSIDSSAQKPVAQPQVAE